MSAILIVGFPMCGAAALKNLLCREPGIESGRDRAFAATLDAAAGAIRHAMSDPTVRHLVGSLPELVYQPGLLESVSNLELGPNKLIVLVVNNHLASLLRWKDTHQRAARANAIGSGHFTTATVETKEFFSTCSYEDYFRDYADRLIDYGAWADRVAKTHSGLLLLVRESTMITEPVRVVRSLLEVIGDSTAPTETRPLPVGQWHVSPEVDADAVPASIVAECEARDTRLESALARYLSV